MKENEISFTRLRSQIRGLLLLFMTGMILSGLTAFPIEFQLQWAVSQMEDWNWHGTLFNWLQFVYEGVKNTNEQYSFIAYGTDWLAFAHLIIAVAFIGPLRSPVRNVWVIEFGLIACASIIPFAFIAGSFRAIPFFWQCVDCSFGVGGGMLLWIIYRKIQQLGKMRVDVPLVSK